jgi:hypothetical protein
MSAFGNTTSLHGRRAELLNDNSARMLVDGKVLAADGAPVAAGSALTLTAARHAGRIIQLNAAAGSTVTLPAATGSGNRYRFYVSALATSNAHVIKVANADDTMIGGVVTADTDTADAALSFYADATADTITLNRSTTGSVSLGEYIEIIDVAPTKFLVRGNLSATGNPATPFSATVS